jgi:hypothetical protein
MEDDHLLHMERSVWDALKRKDLVAFDNLLAAEFYEIDVAGHVTDKHQHLLALPHIYIYGYDIVNFYTTMPVADLEIVRYQITVNGTLMGKEFLPGPYNTTSVWVRRDGSWVKILYQETQIRA